MSFSIGIVGLPNVGKSTLFKALTQKQVDISNYPFCTIDKNIGIVAVPDKRLNKLAEILKPEKILPTTIKFVDIAGLVKNAHQGEGLGNQFLSHIREVDAILHLIRAFQNKNITHVAGKVNPAEDTETIKIELIYADLETLDKKIKETGPKAKSGDKEEIKKLEIYKKLKKHLEAGNLANSLSLTKEDLEEIKELNLLTLKPILEVYNANENDPVPPGKLKISCKLEEEISELSVKEKKELGYEKSGLDNLIKECYRILNLITFFTIQNKILQAWTLSQDSSALQAAAKIHSDFAEGFIKAEVIDWKDLVEAGSELKVREKGLTKIVGKEYKVQDGDIMHFLFNT